jgi:hypothetical protein
MFRERPKQAALQNDVEQTWRPPIDPRMSGFLPRIRVREWPGTAIAASSRDLM